MLVVSATAAAVFFGMTAFVPAAGAQEAAPAIDQYETLLTPILSGNQTIIGQTIAYPPGVANVTAALVTIPPGGETGWHLHEVPLFGYILDGELTVDYGSEGTRIYGAGDGFLEAIDWPHNGVNLTDAPVTILAVYIGADGSQNSIPVERSGQAEKLAPGDDHVVAMHHFRSSSVAEYGLDFRTVAATDPFSIIGIEGDEPAAYFLPLWPQYLDGVAALKPPSHARNSGRQQAFARAESAKRSFIHYDGPAGLEVTRYPLLARGTGLGLGDKPSAPLTIGDGGKGVHAMTPGDDHGGTGAGGNSGGLNLGLHPASGKIGSGAASHRLYFGGYALNQIYELGVRIDAWRG